jgi:tight adherence protein C
VSGGGSGQTVLLWLALGAVLAMMAAAAFLMVQVQRQGRLQRRLRATLHATEEHVSEERAGGFSLRGGVISLGLTIARSGLLSQKTVEGLRQTLSTAGMRGTGALGMFVGCKLLLLAGLPLVGLALATHFAFEPLYRNIAVAGGAVLGLLLPDWWVRNCHVRYLKAVQAGLPDALDMMVICAEAGLGFEPALSRVGQEIRHAHPAIADEFSQTANELLLLADSRVALANMGTRTGVESLKRMAAMLTQTMQFGTPLGDALRVLSAEVRHERMVQFEARAARLPVLLTLPMIVFILPCIFLVVCGPAAIQVMHSLQH